MCSSQFRTQPQINTLVIVNNETSRINIFVWIFYKNILRGMYKAITLREMTSTSRVEQMKVVQTEALALFTRKNEDYGDAFAEYGVIGVLMRIEDKLKRSMSITKNGVNLVRDEGIRDTLIDLHNYAAMAIMLIDEKDEE